MNDMPEAEPDLAEEESFFRQLLMMGRAFMASQLRTRLIALLGGIFAVIVLTALGQVVLNRWNQPFYDAIERRDLDEFFAQLIVFAEIAGALLVLNVGQTWLNQMLHLKLREGLTRDLVGEWMQPRRAFRLADAGAIGINPDQRLHEDARHLADLTADLGIGLLQATILLVSFVGVLWSISSNFVFHIDGRAFDIPGYMVWAAVIYAGTASMLSWLFGRPLIRLNSDRYAREAELRFSLVRVNEHLDAISLAGGEADERRRLELDLASVLAAARRIVTATVRLTWFTAGYGWVTVVAPIVIASPVYFAGDLTFGGLIMAAAAFTQVHASLRWFVDNIGGIADWRATLLRVASFRSALLRVDEFAPGGERIDLGANESGRMTFEGVEVVSPAGRTDIDGQPLEIGPGDRVAVEGRAGFGKTLLFRAIAGLWPWGRGRIGLPSGASIAFVPTVPYVPSGPLRRALVYPHAVAEFREDEVAPVLSRLGLDRLTPMLDREARWDRELSEEEQRLLAFARLALQKPSWIVIDEALDALQPAARRRVLDLMAERLPDAAILNIGHGEGEAGFFPRTVRLTLDPDGRAAPRRGRKAVQPMPAG